MNSASVVVLALMIAAARCQIPGLAMPEMGLGNMGELAMLSNMMGGGSGGSGGGNMLELAALSSMMGGEGMGAMMPGGGSNNLAQLAMLSSMMENQKPTKQTPVLAQTSGNGSGAMPMPGGGAGRPTPLSPTGPMAPVPGMPPMAAGAPVGSAQQPPMSMMAMMNSMGPQGGMNSLAPNAKTLDLMREGLGVSPVVSKMLCPAKQCPFPLPCENPKTLYSAQTFYVCPDCPKCPAQIMQSLMRDASQKLGGMGVPTAMRGLMSQRVATKNMEQLIPV